MYNHSTLLPIAQHNELLTEFFIQYIIYLAWGKNLQKWLVVIAIRQWIYSDDNKNYLQCILIWTVYTLHNVLCDTHLTAILAPPPLLCGPIEN